MRHLAIALTCALGVACQRSVEVRGLYLAGPHAAVLAPCGNPRVVWSTPDSALRARYEQLARGGSEAFFVRVRGFSADSAGSIYGQLGGAKPRFLVQQILEVRPWRAGDCSEPAAPIFESVARLYLTQ